MVVTVAVVLRSFIMMFGTSNSVSRFSLAFPCDDALRFGIPSQVKVLWEKNKANYAEASRNSLNKSMGLCTFQGYGGEETRALSVDLQGG